MDAQLRRAIDDGKDLGEKRKVEEAKRVRAEAEERVKAYAAEVEKQYARIRKEPSVLFDQIKEAVAKGEMKLELRESEAFADAVRKIEGLSATWSKKCTQYDEGVTDDYIVVEIRWQPS